MNRTASIHPSPVASLCCAAGVFLLSQASASADVATLSRYARGLLAEHQGETEEALTHFEATLAADPHSFTVAGHTARLHLRARDDLAAASKVLRTFATEHPHDLPAQLYYVDFLRGNSPRDAMARKVAREILTAAHQNFPHTPGVIRRLIEVCEEAEDREASRALFEAEVAADRHDPALWVALIPIARNLIAGDDPAFRPTLDTLHDRALRDGVSSRSVARRVSDYYRQQGKAERAIDVLRKHVAAVPDSLELRTRLGLLLVAADRPAEGRQTLEETVAIDPDFAYAHRALAQLHQREGNTEKSLHHQAEVLRIEGGSARDFLALANKYLEAKNPHRARLLLERARFDHPQDAAVAARLAVATLRDGDTRSGARLFREAEALAEESGDPGAREILDTDFQLEFAEALRAGGELALAEARYREAARTAPEDEPAMGARALRELARLWLDQDKNHGPAVSLLQRAEALDPGNAETAALMERAKRR